MGREIGVEPVVHLQHEHVLPVHVDVLGIFQVVGEKFEFRVKLDVLRDGILELGHGTGTEFITDLVVERVDVFVIRIKRVAEIAIDESGVVDDGPAACDG